MILSLHPVIRSLVLVSGSLLLGACAALPQMDTDPQPAQAVAPKYGLPQDIAVFLGSDPGEASARFENSPWGQGVVVTARPTYFSAIGKPCRRMAVSGSSQALRLVACEEQSGVWSEHRLVVR